LSSNMVMRCCSFCKRYIINSRLILLLLLQLHCWRYCVRSFHFYHAATLEEWPHDNLTRLRLLITAVQTFWGKWPSRSRSVTPEPITATPNADVCLWTIRKLAKRLIRKFGKISMSPVWFELVTVSASSMPYQCSHYSRGHLVQSKTVNMTHSKANELWRNIAAL
jgi:hypothetical protein